MRVLNVKRLTGTIDKAWINSLLGIDVADIGHVINYDLPQVAEDYIHRIGRSGRAGSTGQALSLIAPEEHDLWEDIMRLLIKTGSATPQQEK